MKKDSNYCYKRWLYQAPIALVIIGFGACLISEAAMIKYSDPESWDWVMAGTLALIVFNSGISLFGDAVLWRMRYEQLESDLKE